MQVLIPVGLGTEEMEAVIMVNVLRKAGADVVLASVEPQLEVKLSGGTTLVADVSISECSDKIYDLVALPVSPPNFKPSYLSFTSVHYICFYMHFFVIISRMCL